MTTKQPIGRAIGAVIRSVIIKVGCIQLILKKIKDTLYKVNLCKIGGLIKKTARIACSLFYIY